MPLYGPYRIEQGAAAADPRSPLAQGRPVTLSCGRRQATVTFQGGPTGVIRLPKATLGRLLLPPGVRLYLKPKPGGFELGPVVGLLVGVAKRSTYRLNELKPVARAGPGLVVAFALANLRPKTGGVHGLYWDGHQWRSATLPWPGGVFRRCRLQGNLDRLVGAPTFNYSIGNKWRVHQLLEANPRLLPYLPKTVEVRQLDQLLDRYPSIYLKPKGGSLGVGIYRLSRQAKGFEATTRQRGNNVRLKFKDRKSLGIWLKKKGHYLAQQGIPVLKLGGRPVDFRLMVQKTGRNLWASRIVARVGAKGSPVTNVAQGSTTQPGPPLLTATFGPNKTQQLVSELDRLGRLVGETLAAKGGRLGDLGLDVAITPQGRPWLLEVNSLPLHYGSQRQLSPPIARWVAKNPLAYAGYLAGFPS